MAVMDEFKEEREALKNGTRKEKFSYFLDYYKWYVVVGAAVIIFAGSMIYEIVTQKETAFYAMMLNCYRAAEQEVVEQDFADAAGINRNDYDILFDTSLSVSEDYMDETSATSAQKLMVYTAAAELDVMITDPDTFQRYAYGNNFHDLRDIMSEEQLEKYEPYFYYVDGREVERIDAANDAYDDTYEPNYLDPTKPEEMEDPIPIGLFLNDCSKLKDNFYFQSEDVAMGIYLNTQHLDTVFDYLDYLFAE